jgi:hypothetical protein
VSIPDVPEVDPVCPHCGQVVCEGIGPRFWVLVGLLVVVWVVSTRAVWPLLVGAVVVLRPVRRAVVAWLLRRA